MVIVSGKTGENHSKIMGNMGKYPIYMEELSHYFVTNVVFFTVIFTT